MLQSDAKQKSPASDIKRNEKKFVFIIETSDKKDRRRISVPPHEISFNYLTEQCKKLFEIDPKNIVFFTFEDEEGENITIK